MKKSLTLFIAAVVAVAFIGACHEKHETPAATTGATTTHEPAAAKKKAPVAKKAPAKKTTPTPSPTP